MRRWLRALLSLLDRMLRVRVDSGVRLSPIDKEPPDPLGARAVVDLAARIGEVALASGASAADTTAMVLRVLYSQGVRAHVDVTFTSVTVSYTHNDDIDPITRMRVVRALGMDYDLLAWLERRVDAVCTGQQTVEQTRRRLLTQKRNRPLYREWVLLAAAGVQGAAICALIGGRLGDALLAGLGTMLVDATVRALARRRISGFVGYLVAGAIPAAIGLAVMQLRLSGADELWVLSPSLIVATGMITMLAGMGVVSASQDALDGFYITSAARTIDFVSRTGGLVLGVAATLWVGVQVGVPTYLAPEWQAQPPGLIQVAVAVPFCVAFAMTTWLGPRSAIICGLLGGLGYLIYLAGMAATGIHQLSAGLMALGVGVLATLVSGRLGVPRIALITVAIAPQMPGLTLYRAVFPAVTGQAAQNSGDDPAALLVASLLAGAALALGASLGVTLARNVAPPTERFALHALWRSWSRGQAPRSGVE